MIKEKLYCPETKHCYFLTYQILDQLSNDAELDIELTKNEMGKLTNTIINPTNNQELFSSDNPLKLLDFLKGYINGLNNTNNIKETI